MTAKQIATALCLSLLLASCEAGPQTRRPETATIVVPEIAGKPKVLPFAGHPGWADVFPAGESSGISARIGEDATFAVRGPDGPAAMIFTLDGCEIPAIVVPDWPRGLDGGRLVLPVDYSCFPAGYPEAWDKSLGVKVHEYWQTFVPRSRFLYGWMSFDGPRVVWWGNKANASVHRDRPGGPRIDFTVPWGVGPDDNPSAHHTDHAFPRVGWRHGNVPVTPGKTCAIRLSGYKSHGNEKFPYPTFIRPDGGDGVEGGRAFVGHTAINGDMCMLLFGSLHGQYIENHCRSEEWNVFIPKRKPVEKWGQTFKSHGVSLAGLRFWGSNGGEKEVSCRVRIREDGPGGKQVGPVKTSVAHTTSTKRVIEDSPERPRNEPPPGGIGAPVIRYPEQPGPLPGYERYYESPYDLFQAAYVPDEVSLEPGKTYYIEIEASEPVSMLADGDFYEHGFGYYDGEKVEREPHLMHGDPRWTLLIDIVTYAKPGGAPE